MLRADNGVIQSFPRFKRSRLICPKHSDEETDAVYEAHHSPRSAQSTRRHQKKLIKWAESPPGDFDPVMFPYDEKVEVELIAEIKQPKLKTFARKKLTRKEKTMLNTICIDQRAPVPDAQVKAPQLPALTACKIRDPFIAGSHIEANWNRSRNKKELRQQVKAGLRKPVLEVDERGSISVSMPSMHSQRVQAKQQRPHEVVEIHDVDVFEVKKKKQVIQLSGSPEANACLQEESQSQTRSSMGTPTQNLRHLAREIEWKEELDNTQSATPMRANKSTTSEDDQKGLIISRYGMSMDHADTNYPAQAETLRSSLKKKQHRSQTISTGNLFSKPWDDSEFLRHDADGLDVNDVAKASLQKEQKLDMTMMTKMNDVEGNSRMQVAGQGQSRGEASPSLQPDVAHSQPLHLQDFASQAQVLGTSKLHYDGYPFPWLNTMSQEPPPPFHAIQQNRNTLAVSAQVEPYQKLFDGSGCQCEEKCRPKTCTCMARGGQYSYLREKVQHPATDGIS